MLLGGLLYCQKKTFKKFAISEEIAIVNSAVLCGFVVDFHSRSVSESYCRTRVGVVDLSPHTIWLLKT